MSHNTLKDELRSVLETEEFKIKYKGKTKTVPAKQAIVLTLLAASIGRGQPRELLQLVETLEPAQAAQRIRLEALTEILTVLSPLLQEFIPPERFEEFAARLDRTADEFANT